MALFVTLFVLMVYGNKQIILYLKSIIIK